MYNTSYYVKLAFSLLDAALRRFYGYYILGTITVALYVGWLVQFAGGSFLKGAALSTLVVVVATILAAFDRAVLAGAEKNKPFWDNLLPGILNIILHRFQVYKVLAGGAFILCIFWVTSVSGGDFHRVALPACCSYVSALISYLLVKTWRLAHR